MSDSTMNSGRRSPFSALVRMLRSRGGGQKYTAQIARPDGASTSGAKLTPIEDVLARAREPRAPE